MPPSINHAKCSACGRCHQICHQDVFYGSVAKAVPVITYPDECWHCGACAVECPENAIRFEIPLPMRLSFRGEVGKKKLTQPTLDWPCPTESLASQEP